MPQTPGWTPNHIIPTPGSVSTLPGFDPGFSWLWDTHQAISFQVTYKKLRKFYLSVPNNWWSREGVYRPECIFPLKDPEWFMRFHYNETETFTAMWSLYCVSILAPMLYCVIFKHKIRKFWISLYCRCPILNRGWVIQGRSLFFQQGGFLLPLIYTRLLVEKFSSQVFKKCNQNKEEPHLLIACKDFESSVKRRFQFLHGLSTIQLLWKQLRLDIILLYKNYLREMKEMIKGNIYTLKTVRDYHQLVCPVLCPISSNHNTPTII